MTLSDTVKGFILIKNFFLVDHNWPSCPTLYISLLQKGYGVLYPLWCLFMKLRVCHPTVLQHRKLFILLTHLAEIICHQIVRPVVKNDGLHIPSHGRIVNSILGKARRFLFTPTRETNLQTRYSYPREGKQCFQQHTAFNFYVHERMALLPPLRDNSSQVLRHKYSQLRTARPDQLGDSKPLNWRKRESLAEDSRPPGATRYTIPWNMTVMTCLVSYRWSSGCSLKRVVPDKNWIWRKKYSSAAIILGRAMQTLSLSYKYTVCTGLAAWTTAARYPRHHVMGSVFPCFLSVGIIRRVFCEDRRQNFFTNRTSRYLQHDREIENEHIDSEGSFPDGVVTIPKCIIRDNGARLLTRLYALHIQA